MSLALRSEGRVVTLDLSTFVVHFLREAKLLQTVGQGRKLIKAVEQHLAVHDAVAVANADGVSAGGAAHCLGKRLLNRGEDFAVIGAAGGLWDQAGGLAHQALSEAHRRVLRYVALYLRKSVDSVRVPALA